MYDVSHHKDKIRTPKHVQLYCNKCIYVHRLEIELVMSTFQLMKVVHTVLHEYFVIGWILSRSKKEKKKTPNRSELYVTLKKVVMEAQTPKAYETGALAVPPPPKKNASNSDKIWANSDNNIRANFGRIWTKIRVRSPPPLSFLLVEIFCLINL